MTDISEYSHNWAGNIAYAAARYHRPETLAQLQDIVANSRKLRVLGSRHSFNTLADSDEDLVVLDCLDQTVTVDRARHSATVSAGITYGQLGIALQREGLAIHNMASLPHISVAGAIATATHGSGDANGNLATAVCALELVKANGDLITLTREKDGDLFCGAVVGLGAVGVVTKVTLDVQPAFTVQQEVYENLPDDALFANFDHITSAAYSVSLFTDWQSSGVSEVWLKRRLPNDVAQPVLPTFFGATPSQVERHPVVRLDAAPCTPQLGNIGAWNERLPHFRIDHVPASGDEIQTEYFVPRHHAVAAMRALADFGKHMGELMWISEVRTIAADDLWMSPCYKQTGVGLHFSWHRNWPAVQAMLPELEHVLAPFEARPHWGKLFVMAPDVVKSRYARMADFRELLNTFDPGGKFRNAFIDAYIFG
jgi:xylitol oxidase